MLPTPVLHAGKLLPIYKRVDGAHVKAPLARVRQDVRAQSTPETNDGGQSRSEEKGVRVTSSARSLRQTSARLPRPVGLPVVVRSDAVHSLQFMSPMTPGREAGRRIKLCCVGQNAAPLSLKLA